jgi:hypothetical protein
MTAMAAIVFACAVLVAVILGAAARGYEQRDLLPGRVVRY